MAPGTYDYTVKGGDCLPLRVILKDSNGDPLSLAGYTSRFEATWRGGSISLTSGADELDVADADSPMSGEIVGQLSGAQTAQFPAGALTSYTWSVTQPNGCLITFLEGAIIRL